MWSDRLVLCVWHEHAIHKQNDQYCASPLKRVTAMRNGFQTMVHQPNLLKVMIQIREWENVSCHELQTLSGRDLYFRIAARYLEGLDSPQQLKLLHGQLTERTTRLRMREFETQGLIHVARNDADQRTRQAIPTEKFLQNLNMHLNQMKTLCDVHYVMVDKCN